MRSWLARTQIGPGAEEQEDQRRADVSTEGSNVLQFWSKTQALVALISAEANWVQQWMRVNKFSG